MQGLAAGSTAAALAPVSALAQQRAAEPAGGRRRIIIDTDTATDDAVAILLAMNAPDVKVEAVTMVVGNVDFDQEARNALYTLQISGHAKQVPVFLGSSRPLLRAFHADATYIHGKDGMSNSFFAAPEQKPEQEWAIDAMIRLIETYPHEITIVAIGALTNIALLLLRKPSIVPLIKSIFFMGGCYKFYGNVTPVATYNIWVDPEAASIVFHSGVPLTSVGFDTSVHYSIFTDADYDRVAQLGTPLSKFFIDINKIRRVYCKEHQKMNGSNHPDALTTALFLDPTLGVEMLSRYCDVETEGQLTRGTMVIDELNIYKQSPNVTLCVGADEKKFKDMVFRALSKTA